MKIYNLKQISSLNANALHLNANETLLLQIIKDLSSEIINQQKSFNTQLNELTQQITSLENTMIALSQGLQSNN